MQRIGYGAAGVAFWDLTGQELWGLIGGQVSRQDQRWRDLRDVLAAQLAAFLSELLVMQGTFHIEPDSQQAWAEMVPPPQAYFEAWTGRASSATRDEGKDPFGGLYDPALLSGI